jgi:hypothetical protein
MATFANFTVNDRESSPVAHIFATAGRLSSDTVLWKEAGIVPAGDKTVSGQVVRVPNGSFRCRLALKVPLLGTRVADGITTYEVLDEAFFETIVRFSSKSTLQFRKNVMGMGANMLAAAITPVNDAFVNVETW